MEINENERNILILSLAMKIADLQRKYENTNEEYFIEQIKQAKELLNKIIDY